MPRESIGPHLAPAVHRQVIELGEMLGVARRERGWTQAELGNRVGVGRMTVVRMEKGSPEVSVGTYLSAAWLLELPVLSWSEPGGGLGASAMASILAGLRGVAPRRPRRGSTTRRDAD
jgi:DNA-binding XRE family transcriptional regulator